MNIIFITAEFPYPPNSGGRIYTWHRIKHLSETNDIFLFSLIEDSDMKHLNDEIVKKTFKSINIYKRKNKLKKAIKGYKYPFSVATRKIEDIRMDIGTLVDKVDIDLIIIDHPQMLINCNMDYDIPKILTQHNIEYKAFKSMYKNSNSIIKKIIFKREFILMKKFEEEYYKNDLINAYTFISEEDRQYFEKKYKKENLHLIPPGIDFIEKKYIKEKNNAIVFTGKMDYEPNVQAMKWFCNNVFPQIKLDIPDAKLYIVGKNPSKYINSLADESIIVTGAVNSVENYLKLANIVVIPLLSGGGVKIKLMEALQYRNIVVTTNIGIEGTKFKHGEHLLSTNNASEFAESCINALNKPEKYNQQIENSLSCIENNYLWSVIGKNYESLINKISKKVNK